MPSHLTELARLAIMTCLALGALIAFCIWVDANFHKRGHLLDKLVSLALLLVALLVISVIGTAARAHDIYSHTYNNRGSLCCGGDPVTGDCEPLSNEQIHERNGQFIVDSRRYGISIVLPTKDIQWGGIPGEVPGTAGHWCGKPRAAFTSNQYVDHTEVDDSEPDPVSWTFCAFINPGGV